MDKVLRPIRHKIERFYQTQSALVLKKIALKNLLIHDSTGWGQCIGTPNRGYCKAGVKDTLK